MLLIMIIATTINCDKIITAAAFNDLVCSWRQCISRHYAICTIIIPILQMKELVTEKLFAPNHTAQKWQNWVKNPERLIAYNHCDMHKI